MIVELVKNDMKRSLGVTEPGAIAYAGAVARSLLSGEIITIELLLNSGIYKNSFTCGIPNTDKQGCAYAAALGVLAGDAKKRLEALSSVTNDDSNKAQRLIEKDVVKVKINAISSEIFIKLTLTTENGIVSVTIEGEHDRISEILLNGLEIRKAEDKLCDSVLGGIGNFCIREIYEHCISTDVSKLDFLYDAFLCDRELFYEGKEKGFLKLTKAICGSLDEEGLSAHELSKLYTCGAIEARVKGAMRPAMAIAGSGSHGILCIMPVFSAGAALRLKKDDVLIAALFSCAVTMYIKHFSGKLSAACGCVMAGGMGAALGLIMLRGLGFDAILHGINTMASSLTGLICHGGNPGCVMKALSAVDMMFNAVRLASFNVSVERMHGILDMNPDKTLQNMSIIASSGMLETENTIMEILVDKLNCGIDNLNV